MIAVSLRNTRKTFGDQSSQVQDIEQMVKVISQMAEGYLASIRESQDRVHRARRERVRSEMKGLEEAMAGMRV